MIDHLDHLEKLGVGGIWLSPISKARTDKIDEWGAFHGYWVSDLAAIEPRMGTMEDAAELSKAQIEAFTRLVNHNNRPTQPLHGRLLVWVE